MAKVMKITCSLETTNTSGGGGEIEVDEMRMLRSLRWMRGVKRKYMMRNEHIRGTSRVAQAAIETTERRLNWYGRVMRTDEEHILRKVLRTDT